MQALPWWQTIPLFLIIIGILVIVHELGHYLAARRFGVEAPEFGVGFPPRLLTFWKTNGRLEIQGRKIVIPKNFVLPEGLKAGTWVTYKTETQNGKAVLSGLAPVDDESRGLMHASQVQLLDRGTEFTLNAIPLGGFVRMNEDDSSTAPNAFVSKPAWQRAIILVAGVTMNFILAFLVFIALAWWAPQSVTAATTTIVSVMPNTPAAVADLRAGDSIVSVNGVDVKNNREKMLQQLIANCEKPVKLGVERLDPRGRAQLLEITLTPKPSGEIACALGVRITVDVGAKITAVAPNSIAASLGLREGDALVKVGDFTMLATDGGAFGGRLRDEQDLAAHLSDFYKVDSLVIVRYLRDSVPYETKVKIPADLSPEQANLGLNFHMTLPQAFGEASSQMYIALTSVPRALRDMVGNISRGQSSGVVGPAGIGQIIAEGTPSGGLPFIISVIGVLSLNLAIFNLFPIPGLDGGRLIFVLAEMIMRGRKLDPRKEGYIHLAGFMFLLMLIFVISYFDVTRMLSGKSPFGP
ncbi:MAG: RIP metalloprotease RseP [Chloroflexi bacterium]|nr:RIP metalloprotease RseP [Chloroflexota bacterium]